MAEGSIGSPQVTGTAPAGQAPVRLPSLTGLRWFAAFAVFGFHVHHSGLSDDRVIDRFLSVLFGAGASGVPFFFILSGMVLTWSAREGTPAVTFWRRRAARVLPNHMVTWAGTLALLLLAREQISTGPAVAGLFLTQAWIPDIDYFFAVNTPAWSLSCEIAFYAAFPLLLPLVKRIAAGRLWTVAALLLAGVWLMPLVTLVLPVDIGYWLVWIFPVPRAMEFALGMVLARMVREGRWRGPGLLPSVALVLVAYVAVPYAPEAWKWVAWMTGPYAVLIAAAAVSDVRGSRSVLRGRALVWLGEVSFAFYLVHQGVIRLVVWAVGHDQPPSLEVASMLAMLALTLLGSWALYRLVERPLERRLGRPRLTG
ncbi:acyltransferase [Spongiactinospora gelatinilytica]|uniref:Acyltransferase n=1 Tax=Spongiactinospora gelatinilytica TaxID=2666298 RepID=A0A2W2GXI1_9ACTN|nr:acyltransferase [Spongiactinospora gelatinilytica]PZG42310.1 acyltransferase [Spongiactinospora gelatinilytica]